MSSDKKRETNRRNAGKSTGAKSVNGKAHSASNSTTHGRYAKSFVPRGDDRKPFHELEHELREALQPQSKPLEIYFRRLVRIQWNVQQTERAILRYTEATTHHPPPDAPDANRRDADLIALKPEVDAAYERQRLARTNPPDARAKKRQCRAEEIDRAILDGLAHPGQGGQLSQLREELRKLERDFDRNLKIFLALQRDEVIEITPRLVRDRRRDGRANTPQIESANDGDNGADLAKHQASGRKRPSGDFE
jgi:hypothetical protein